MKEAEPSIYHTPVMLRESIDGLDIKPGGTYVDVTFGGGGHSSAIMRRLGVGGRLFAFDQDADAEKETLRLAGDGAAMPEFTFVRSNFRYLANWMRYYGVKQIDGLLADLGVSSHHLDDASRGFSFRADAPLDMRMNRNGGLTAADIINTATEERIADILYMYGELRDSRRLAAAIVRARQARAIVTTGDLVAAVKPLIHRDRETKDAARLFQALRIEVNHELDALVDMLGAAISLLAQGGRIAVITYHSLEDRIVKNMFKTGNVGGRLDTDIYGRTTAPLKQTHGKVIVPGSDETAANPRSRSAKLRIAEKIQQ